MEGRELSSKEIITARKDRFRSLGGDRMDNPRAVILAGQQGSGKSTAQEESLDALSAQEAGAVSYDGDDNSKFHPRYERLMLKDDLKAHPVVANEMSYLHRESIDYVTKQRCNVVASHPMQKTEWAHTWIDQFREKDYSVSVVYVATPDSTSLLGIVDRFQHDGRDADGYGRWVDPGFHDETYRAIPDVAHELESTGRVDSMYVVSRDGDLLHQNHLGSDGVMRGPLGAREAIVAERNRPKTEAETADFAMKLERSRANAPEWAQGTLDDAEKRHNDHLERTGRATGRELGPDRQEERQTLKESLQQAWTPERVSSASAEAEPRADPPVVDSAQRDGSGQGGSEPAGHAGADEVSDRADFREQTSTVRDASSHPRDVAGEDREVVGEPAAESERGPGDGQSTRAPEPRDPTPSEKRDREQTVERDPRGEPDQSGEADRNHSRQVPDQAPSPEAERVAPEPAASENRPSSADSNEADRAPSASSGAAASNSPPEPSDAPEPPEPAERSREAAAKVQRAQEARDEASDRQRAPDREPPPSAGRESDRDDRSP